MFTIANLGQRSLGLQSFVQMDLISPRYGQQCDDATQAGRDVTAIDTPAPHGLQHS
jgi:hypothetical protein